MKYLGHEINDFLHKDNRMTPLNKSTLFSLFYIAVDCYKYNVMIAVHPNVLHGNLAQVQRFSIYKRLNDISALNDLLVETVEVVIRKEKTIIYQRYSSDRVLFWDYGENYMSIFPPIKEVIEPVFQIVSIPEFEHYVNSIDRADCDGK